MIQPIYSLLKALLKTKLTEFNGKILILMLYG